MNHFHQDCFVAKVSGLIHPGNLPASCLNHREWLFCAKIEIYEKNPGCQSREIALRVMRTARRMGIQTVAVYMKLTGMPARPICRRAYLLGPAPSNESYLKMDKILEIALRTG